MKTGRPAEAERLLRGLLNNAPGDRTVRAGLAHCLRLQRREREALEVLHGLAPDWLRELASCPAGTPVHAAVIGGLLDCAFELQECLADAASLALLDEALTHGGSGARLHHLRARAALRLARLDVADEASAQALALAPEEAQVQLLRAEVDSARGEARAAYGRLLTLADRRDVPAPLRARALRLAAQSADRMRAYEEVFPLLARVKALLGPAPAALAKAGRTLIDSLQITAERCSADWLARHRLPAPADDVPRVAFLFGYLRSGTTLLEHRLSAHPSVTTSNESSLMDSVLAELAQRAGGGHWMEQVERLGREGLEDLRAHYHARLLTEFPDLPAKYVFVDKTALNTVHAGLIDLLFAGAPVLFCLRDPRDVALSCHLQAFEATPLTAAWSDWQEGARAYAAVMTFWRAIATRVSLVVHRVRYEAMVADPDGTTRSALAALGFEAASTPATDIGPGTAPRPGRSIRTPAFLDVQRPVHAGAVARWRHYPGAFAQVAPILAPSVEAFGYG